MRLGSRSLLDQIQSDALDSSVPLSTALRKLVALGGEAGSADLREWASLELEGYVGRNVPLPDYRKTGAVIEIDGTTMTHQIKGQQIGPHHLPEGIREQIDEEVPFPHPVGAIESMVARAKGNGGFIKITLPGSQLIVSMMNHENRQRGVDFQTVAAVYWSVSVPALEGMLEQIRARLTRLVAEMRAAMPSDVEVPAAEVADQAVNVAIYGGMPTVTVTNAQASGSGSHTVTAAPLASAPRSRPWWKSIWALLVGVASIVGAVIALWQVGLL